ncbi:MAG: DUF192 domain-containing protein [Candidatus Altiarchaeota archaeon]|nr:DUF192 domain-containing protein [Candidatus Altiarchaeota archaeon]
MLSKRKDIVLAAKKDSKLDSTIHMMNMLYEIDVIWVNSEMKVVDYRKKVKPFNMFKPSTWKTYAPAEAAKYVIELGTTPLGNINVGDDISFD